MDSRKVVLMNLLQCSSGDADIEHRLMDKGGGEEGEGEMSGERSVEAYTLQYAK